MNQEDLSRQITECVNDILKFSEQQKCHIDNMSINRIAPNGNIDNYISKEMSQTYVKDLIRNGIRRIQTLLNDDSRLNDKVSKIKVSLNGENELHQFGHKISPYLTVKWTNIKSK